MAEVKQFSFKEFFLTDYLKKNTTSKIMAGVAISIVAIVSIATAGWFFPLVAVLGTMAFIGHVADKAAENIKECNGEPAKVKKEPTPPENTKELIKSKVAAPFKFVGNLIFDTVYGGITAPISLYKFAKASSENSRLVEAEKQGAKKSTQTPSQTTSPEAAPTRSRSNSHAAKIEDGRTQKGTRKLNI